MSRRGKVALVVLGVFGAAVTLAVIGLFAFFIMRQASQPSRDEQAIEQAFYDKLPDEWSRSLKSKEEIRVYDIKVDEIGRDWAIAEVNEFDQETGEIVGTHPGLMIFRKIEDEWKPAFDRTLYEDWLWQLPESLIPYELKILLQ